MLVLIKKSIRLSQNVDDIHLEQRSQRVESPQVPPPLLTSFFPFRSYFSHCEA